MKVTEPKTWGRRTTSLLAEAVEPFYVVAKSWSNVACSILRLHAN